jgi:hypothetical protein
MAGSPQIPFLILTKVATLMYLFQLDKKKLSRQLTDLLPPGNIVTSLNSHLTDYDLRGEHHVT